MSKYIERITTRSGRIYGLTLLINTEKYEYFFKSNSSGIQVLIHEPHELPDVKEMGFAVSAGTETLASIKKRLVKRLPELYAKPPNMCENTNVQGYKNPLKYYPQYNLSACHREWRIKIQLSVCGCAPHTYVGNNVTVCSCTQFRTCTFDVEAQYSNSNSNVFYIQALVPLKQCSSVLIQASKPAVIVSLHVRKLFMMCQYPALPCQMTMFGNLWLNL